MSTWVVLAASGDRALVELNRATGDVWLATMTGAEAQYAILQLVERLYSLDAGRFTELPSIVPPKLPS